jgi:hypothetical protein
VRHRGTLAVLCGGRREVRGQIHRSPSSPARGERRSPGQGSAGRRLAHGGGSSRTTGMT